MIGSSETDSQLIRAREPIDAVRLADAPALAKTLAIAAPRQRVRELLVDTALQQRDVARALELLGAMIAPSPPTHDYQGHAANRHPDDAALPSARQV